MLKLRGRVRSGIKKGAYYVSLKPYRNFFRSLLGEEPFLGTLNIEVLGIRNPQALLGHVFVPRADGMSPIRYTLGELNGVRVVVIRPEKSAHDPRVLELVSSINLRKKFQLKDGDVVEVALI